MSIDTSESEITTKKDTSWTDLILYAEEEIRAYQEKIKKARKSLNFFRKQSDSGVPFPVKKGARHRKIS